MMIVTDGMPGAVHFALVAFSLILVGVGGYHRVQSQRSGDRLDRTKEGWPILISIRLLGLLTLGATAVWLCNPSLFAWASVMVPVWARWLGVVAFGFSVAWLAWMFRSLGRNLTDTVVTRRNAYFVGHGPYQFVRNPMYTGVLASGPALGLALGTWWIPVATTLLFMLLAVRTRTEERYLLERFDAQYRDYMQRVGRFFPRLPIHGKVRSANS